MPYLFSTKTFLSLIFDPVCKMVKRETIYLFLHKLTIFFVLLKYMISYTINNYTEFPKKLLHFRQNKIISREIKQLLHVNQFHKSINAMIMKLTFVLVYH